MGYAVAQPGDRAAGGGPVWYGGCSLARDLSLPQLQRRWASAPAPSLVLPPEPGEHATVNGAERVAAVAGATTATERAAQVLAAGTGSETDGGDIAHAAGDLLTALAQVIPDAGTNAALRERLREVAEVYDRAARVPRIGQPTVWGAPAQALRTAAWRLAAVQALSGRGVDAAGVVMLLAALTTLAAEVAAYHEARARYAQAAAARRAHRELVAARPADTRPGRGPAPARPGVGRQHPGPAPETQERPAVTTSAGPPGQQPLTPRRDLALAPDQPRQPGRTR
ncbi:MAG: hypothetical protein JO281_19290 [Pseudonocardiales bacterium]|nr:hypothetical protein [Pseudonocardiales bacterium]